MRSSSKLLLVLLAFVSFTMARADTISTFQLQGTLDSGYGGAGGSVSGTVTIDVTTGVITAINATAVTTAASGLGASSASFTTIEDQETDPHGYSFLDAEQGPADLSLGVPFKSLVGYTGSDICLASGNCSGDHSSYTLGANGVPFDTGSLTPQVVAATPEPSGLLLLGTGMLGIVGFARRRLMA